MEPSEKKGGEEALPGQQEEVRAEAGFTPEQLIDIENKRQVLSSLAYFIGKDFNIPIELNEPGAGWHWDFKENKIRVDPKDLLEKPMDYLRFVISHEGGHRRISRAEFIPLEEWQQPGFSAMMNAIEDPRDNNFVAESYPKFKEQMKSAYDLLETEQKLKEEAEGKLGQMPRFAQAGLEYIKQWHRETQGKEFELSAGLPEDIKKVVQATIESARDSWARYPSREMADGKEIIKTQENKKVTGEDAIREFAKVSYEINRDEIWPEFKKLVERDLEDQKMQEALQDMAEEAGKASGQGESQKNKPQKPVNINSLSEEQKEKIKDYIDSLTEEEKEELAKRAAEKLKEFEGLINEELEGKLSDDPEKKAKRQEKGEEEENKKARPGGGEAVRKGALPIDAAAVKGILKYKERIERELHEDANIYEKYRREVLPILQKTETELLEILVKHKITKWKGGFKAGKRTDMQKRIQEKARKISAMESRAWQKRERPNKQDYAISMLNDLSGSMKGKTIEEDFKTKIVFVEALNKIGVEVEILGFNDEIYEYQNFGQPISKRIRDHMGGMFQEVKDSCCKNCGNEHSETDLGWAIKVASERLAKQKAKEKILIILSDWQLAESTKHPASRYDAKRIKKDISKTNIIAIDPGSIKGMAAVDIVKELTTSLGENL